MDIRGCGKDAPTAGIGGLKQRGTRFVGRFSLLLSWKAVGNSVVPSRGERAPRRTVPPFRKEVPGAIPHFYSALHPQERRPWNATAACREQMTDALRKRPRS